MTIEKPKILVPYDYTERSDYAIKYAVTLAKIIEGSIYLLHVVENITEEAEDTKRLNNVAEEVRQKYGVDIEIKIRPGNVQKVIKAIAVTINAFVVIMKSQKQRGQRFVSSRTIRVMTGSKIPFIVIQEAPKRLAFRKVVFPIDFRKENKEKLVWISALSKYYTSKIYLLKPHANDYRVRNNVEFCKRFLEGKNIDYEIITGKRSLSNVEETLEFAHEIDAQLIIIMLSKRISKLNILFGLKEQKYITNKYKIPIMCLNPKAELHRYEGFF